MPITRPQCLKRLRHYLCQDLNLPEDERWVNVQTTFASLNYGSYAMGELTKWVNRSEWYPGHVMPGDVAACTTVGALLDLLVSNAG